MICTHHQANDTLPVRITVAIINDPTVLQRAPWCSCCASAAPPLDSRSAPDPLNASASVPRASHSNDVRKRRGGEWCVPARRWWHNAAGSLHNATYRSRCPTARSCACPERGWSRWSPPGRRRRVRAVRQTLGCPHVPIPFRHSTPPSHPPDLGAASDEETASISTPISLIQPPMSLLFPLLPTKQHINSL